jgi:hypothetical protein
VDTQALPFEFLKSGSGKAEETPLQSIFSFAQKTGTSKMDEFR